MKAILFLFLLPCWLTAQSDLNRIEERIRAELLSEAPQSQRVPQLLAGLQADGTWSGINYADTSRTGFQHYVHLRNAKDLALAFAAPGSDLYRDDELRESLERALSHWARHDYRSANWWHNQLGVPLLIVDNLLLLDGALSGGLRDSLLRIADRADLDAPGARPGGDRIKIGGIAAKRRLLTGDTAAFRHIARVINDEIRFNTGDRGLQHDFSFHHRVDRVNNTTSYGASYARTFAEWAAYLAGTRYAFREREMRLLTDYYLDGICKQMVYGTYPDPGVRNRDISRPRDFAPHPSLTAERLLAASNYRRDELRAIIDRRRGENVPPTSFGKYFWQAEHYVHQRPDYYVSVRFHSDRNRNMEYPYNEEGLTNHFRGDGATFLSKRGDEYHGAWPVYDWHKIPGATVLQVDSMPPADQVRKEGLTHFAGAVTDGRYGVVGYEFISPHHFNRARKAWFFFDDIYVCLGAGIESLEDFSVGTTVEQALLRGTVTIATDSATWTETAGERTFNNLRWVKHNGTGYYFPDSAKIHLAAAPRRGSWRSLSHQYDISADTVSEDLFTLWIDHGDHPQGRRGGLKHEDMTKRDATYAYAVVPNAEDSLLPDRMRTIRILENNRHRQIVRHDGLGLTQCVFYAAGKAEIGDGQWLEMDAPGIVMIHERDGRIISLSAADPSRRLGRLHLRLSGDQRQLADSIHEPRYDDREGHTRFSLQLPTGPYAGTTVQLGEKKSQR